MGSRYLVELADWCRAAGLRVVEDAGWQSRARSSGGYDSGRPWAVMWHHTASQSSPANDVAYITRGSPDSPIANLFLARDGTVYVCAAGATNTNGKGGPLAVSRGTVPQDQMNTYAVSIEAANSGVGERWPQAQIDAYFTLSNTLTARLGLTVDDLVHHHSWSPGRKIDCATAPAVEGPWRPASVNSSGSWSQPDTEFEAAARSGATPSPPTPTPPDPGPGPAPDPRPPLPPEEDDMRLTAAADENGTIWIGNGIERFPVASMAVLSNYIVLASAGCYVLVNASGQAVRQSQDVFAVGGDTIAALGARIA